MTRSTRLGAALVANACLVVAEVVGGLAAHSTGLVADAGHNLTDVAAIGISAGAVRWAMRPRNEVRSYGNHRATILAALANAAFLAVVTCGIVALAISRLVHPAHVAGATVAGVAGAAVAVNALAAVALHDRSRDLNMRAARVHMLADVAASAVVLLAGVAVVVGGAAADRADAAASLVVGVLVLVEAVRLVRESADVLLESTPPDVDLADLRRLVVADPGVNEVHDLHVWSLSSEYRALSAHLLLDGHPSLEAAQEVGDRVRAAVAARFAIAHTTFELECEPCEDEGRDPCAGEDALPEGRQRAPTTR